MVKLNKIDKYSSIFINNSPTRRNTTTTTKQKVDTRVARSDNAGKNKKGRLTNPDFTLHFRTPCIRY
jgi:hypothetical protein